MNRFIDDISAKKFLQDNEISFKDSAPGRLRKIVPEYNRECAEVNEKETHTPFILSKNNIDELLQLKM
tara:strand:- start:3534 stop:3737 length:204 start_codon:yes stop_codon:yes gene_type:complete